MKTAPRCSEDALQPVRPLVPTRHLGAHLRRAGRCRGCAGPTVHRQQLHQGPPLRRRRKRGALAHGIGRTKGGRNTKLHAVCDEKGRPCVLLLTPGNVHDCRVAQRCIEAMPASAELVADKGYDSQALRDWLQARGTRPVIPPRRNRKIQYTFETGPLRRTDKKCPSTAWAEGRFFVAWTNRKCPKRLVFVGRRNTGRNIVHPG